MASGRKFDHAKLQVLRENAGISQSDLAKKLRTKQSSISRWENGEQVPRPRKIKALSIVLKVKVQELFTEEPVLETK